MLINYKAGFEPSSAYVNPVVRFLTGQHYARLSSQLNNPIPQSTSVYGVADPLGCLKPDEVHLSFSSHFGDEPRPFLHETEVIVARHPALRPSDLQKVSFQSARAAAHVTTAEWVASDTYYRLKQYSNLSSVISLTW